MIFEMHIIDEFDANWLSRGCSSTTLAAMRWSKNAVC